MAIEVARAYDEDKNLVPLYILTDSDPIYDPVTPGFVYTAEADPSGSYTSRLTITSNSKNPTGGDMMNGAGYISLPTAGAVSSASTVIVVIIENISTFSIRASVSMSALSTSSIRYSGTINLDSGSNQQIQFEIGTSTSRSGVYLRSFLISVV